MLRSVVTGLSLVWTCFALSTNPTADDQAEDEYEPVPATERFDYFDWRLCLEVQARDPGNAVVSPVSVRLLLAMLYEGLAGNSARQLEAALALPRDRQATRDKYMQLMAALQAPHSDDYSLDFANRIYVDHSIKLRHRFSKIFKAFYNTEIQNADFLNNQATAKIINNWVTNVTQGHVNDLITPDALKNAVMVLLNAVYFKGTWKYEFSINDTRPGSFQVSKAKSITVDYMRLNAALYYVWVDDIRAHIVRLPYKGNRLAMYLVIPSEVDGLQRFIPQIDPFVLRKHLDNMTKYEMNLVLPKFKFDYTIKLKNLLEKIGITDIFKSESNLIGISTSESQQLVVSEVVQKAGLDVNEQGSTMYAATGIVLDNREGAPLLEAKHPFMFFIEDETTGTVICVGKVIEPTVGQSDKGQTKFETRSGTLDQGTHTKTQHVDKKGNSNNKGDGLSQSPSSPPWQQPVNTWNFPSAQDIRPYGLPFYPAQIIFPVYLAQPPLNNFPLSTKSSSKDTKLPSPVYNIWVTPEELEELLRRRPK